MKILKNGAAILTLATMVAFTPTFAQDTGVGGPTATATEEDRPNYTPLLGLLGLLGLMGLKRRNDHRDYNTDARR
jgi:hypothetical protein